MKYIERSDRKTDFSPWRLGDQKTCGDDEGRSSQGGGGHWGSRLAFPRVLGHWREEFGEEEPSAPKTWRERDLRRKQRFGGLNTPGLTPSRTLSGLVGLCLDQLDFVWLGLFVRNRRADLEIFEI
jgi:hypothetical protein